MSKYANCIIEHEHRPMWEAQNESRCVTPLITHDSTPETNARAIVSSASM